MDKMTNMKDTIKGIIIGVVSSLIASGIIYGTTEKFLWNIQLPLWGWLVLTLVILFAFYFIKRLILLHKIRDIISEYTEGAFGDSYVYTWEFKRNRKGQYSVYGYEATKIALKKSLAEQNNEHIFTCGHEVSEQIIKMMIQLTLMSMIKKRLGVLLRPTLEYLHWIENSQCHKLLH